MWHRPWIASDTLIFFPMLQLYITILFLCVCELHFSFMMLNKQTWKLFTNYKLQTNNNNRHQWRHKGACRGAFPPAPIGGSSPLPSEGKKWQKSAIFSAKFLIFAPSEMHFAPSMSPTNKFLVPLPTDRQTNTRTKIFMHEKGRWLYAHAQKLWWMSPVSCVYEN